jgi:hypothetical protein
MGIYTSRIGRLNYDKIRRLMAKADVKAKDCDLKNFKESIK